MTGSENQIGTRPNPRCAMCGTAGQSIYEGLRDCLFGAPGEWNMKKCSNAECGLLWLDPMPAENELGKAYSNYYTHEDADVPSATPLRRVYRRMKAGYIAGKFGYARNDVSRLFMLLGLFFYLAPGRRASLDASVFHLPAQPAHLERGRNVSAKGRRVYARFSAVPAAYFTTIVVSTRCPSRKTVSFTTSPGIFF